MSDQASKPSVHIISSVLLLCAMNGAPCTLRSAPLISLASALPLTRCPPLTPPPRIAHVRAIHRATGLALFLKNLGLVVSVGGAALGSSLVYIFPALMFIQATRQREAALTAKGESLPAGRRNEMYANYGLVGLGVSLAVVGVKMSLAAAGGH